MADEHSSYREIPLFPYLFRYFGIFLMLLGFGAAYLYFQGGRPSVFQVPVFALVTSYAETRWFVIAQTNLLDELAFLFIVTGLMFTGFSKEKDENSLTAQLRSYALTLSVYLTAGIWIILYLVIFGWPIIPLSASVFILFLVLNILTFQILLRKVKSNNIKQINSGVV